MKKSLVVCKMSKYDENLCYYCGDRGDQLGILASCKGKPKCQSCRRMSRRMSGPGGKSYLYQHIAARRRVLGVGDGEAKRLGLFDIEKYNTVKYAKPIYDEEEKKIMYPSAFGFVDKPELVVHKIKDITSRDIRKLLRSTDTIFEALINGLHILYKKQDRITFDMKNKRDGTGRFSQGQKHKLEKFTLKDLEKAIKEFDTCQDEFEKMKNQLIEILIGPDK